MKIYFTKKQYLTLLQSLSISGWVYGIMSDLVDEKYKNVAGKIEDAENYLLSFHKDFSFPKENIESFEKKLFLSEEYEQEFIGDMAEYNEMEFWDGLSNRLAKRDLQRIFSEEEIGEMDSKTRIEHIYKRETMYTEHFMKYGLENINIPFITK